MQYLFFPGQDPCADGKAVLTVAVLLQEENMVAKTIGFNWGPAGTSCSTWTGVRLADVLQHCGMQGQQQNANCVCFRGPKHELPQGVSSSIEVALLYRHMFGCAVRAPLILSFEAS